MLNKVVPMIHVPDVRAAVAWYERIGFEVTATHSDENEMSWALITCGTTEVMFNEGGHPSTAHRREVDLYVYVNDATALYERLKEEVEVVHPLYDAFYGNREFIIRDLNRFWVTFGEPLAQ
ncbi:MAG TPA: VOC family protein [Thermoanaerobaculia bacterium]|nr:VOC family protein [Thermoanaerobaculia bacterium]